MYKNLTIRDTESTASLDNKTSQVYCTRSPLVAKIPQGIKKMVVTMGVWAIQL